MLIARGEHGRAIAQSGLRFGTPEGYVMLPIPVVEGPEQLVFCEDDVVVLAMKGQDTERAVSELAAVAPASTPIVCAQNGVANERCALRRFEFVHAMCVMMPSVHLEPGTVLNYGTPASGMLDIGRFPDGIDEVDERIAADLRAAHFESEARPQTMQQKYGKLLTNLGNAFEAVAGVVSRESDLHVRARAEGLACLTAAGIAWQPSDGGPGRRDTVGFGKIAGTERGSGSSWQSLARGAGSIETDFLNGEIVLLGRLYGIPTPVNAMIVRVANRLARERAPAASLQLDDLERELRSSTPA